MNGIKVNFKTKEIIINQTFANKSSNTQSTEFAELSRIHTLYPNFNTIVEKKKVSKTLRITKKKIEFVVEQNGTETQKAQFAKFETAKKEVNKPFQEHNREYRRQKLFEEYRDFYSSVEEIPVELERSSLQRVIQMECIRCCQQF